MWGILQLIYKVVVIAWRIACAALKLMRWTIKQSYRLLRTPSINYGSARWATKGLLKASGALTGNGLIVGKWGKQLIRDNSKEGSILVFAPQGAGKGVGVVIPNLLDYPGSVICTDPKGENFAITRRAREKFGKVWCLNLEEPEMSDCFNPMECIRLGTVHEGDDAEALADLLMPHDKSSEQHWRRKARSWLTGFILYVAHEY